MQIDYLSSTTYAIIQDKGTIRLLDNECFDESDELLAGAPALEMLGARAFFKISKAIRGRRPIRLKSSDSSDWFIESRNYYAGNVMNENVGEVLGLAFWRLKVEAMDIATIHGAINYSILRTERIK